jgi:hypothetical protein
MKRKIIALALSLAASLWTFLPPTSASAQEPKDARRLLDTILKATENDDYAGFVSVGDLVFKASITPQMLDGVSGQVAPRMKKGYDCIFLGVLNQKGYQVCLWKLVFMDGGDDILAKLVVKNGKVWGAWLQ